MTKNNKNDTLFYLIAQSFQAYYFCIIENIRFLIKQGKLKQNVGISRNVQESKGR